MARSRIAFSLSLVAAIALVALVLGVVGGRATGSAGRSRRRLGRGGERQEDRRDHQGERLLVLADDDRRGEAAGGDFGLKVSTFGPTSETNIDEQVQLVENSISRGVDGIVIAPNSSSALNSAIDRARKAGSSRSSPWTAG